MIRSLLQFTNRVSAVILIAMLAACGGVPFALLDEGRKVKPGSIAIVAVVNHESASRAAEVITEELTKKSAFRVMSQQEILRRIPNYPATIIEQPVGNPDSRDSEWLSHKNKGRIAAVHDKLKTDYLFIVWAENMSKTVVKQQQQGSTCFTFTGYAVDVQGRLLEYPRNTVIGYSIYEGRKTKSCCLLFRSEGEDIDIMLRDSAEEVADRIIAVTGTAK